MGKPWTIAEQRLTILVPPREDAAPPLVYRKHLPGMSMAEVSAVDAYNRELDKQAALARENAGEREAEERQLFAGLVFSHDPNDSSIVRLRIVPPDPEAPAVELQWFAGGKEAQDVTFQPRGRLAFDRRPVTTATADELAAMPPVVRAEHEKNYWVPPPVKAELVEAQVAQEEELARREGESDDAYAWRVREYYQNRPGRNSEPERSQNTTTPAPVGKWPEQEPGEVQDVRAARKWDAPPDAIARLEGESDAAYDKRVYDHYLPPGQPLARVAGEGDYSYQQRLATRAANPPPWPDPAEPRPMPQVLTPVDDKRRKR